jgi:hypothetical protein
MIHAFHLIAKAFSLKCTAILGVNSVLKGARARIELVKIIKSSGFAHGARRCQPHIELAAQTSIHRMIYSLVWPL